MTDAPACPISFGQPIPGRRVFQRGDPWSRPGDLQDLVNQIPRAHDLRSAISALNRINNIVMLISRGEPVVNNVRVQGDPSVILKGNDYNPYYQPNDWVEERRVYHKQKMYNPEDEEQFIEVSVLSAVYFYNPNTSYGLNYYQKVK